LSRPVAQSILRLTALASLLVLMVPVLSIAPVSAATQSSVTVSSTNQSGSTITGFRTVLYASNGTILDKGFTPSTFPTTVGLSYAIRSESYGSCAFSKWSDGVTSDPRTFTATSSPISFTAVYNCGTSSSSVTVDSVNQFQNVITGYYVALYGSTGQLVGSGYTPVTFSTTSGQKYSVQADSYGSCTFTGWSDGVTTNPRPFTATSSSVTFTADYSCSGASQYSTLTVVSVDQAGTGTTGYAVTIRDSTGKDVASGTTPLSYKAKIGQTFTVQANASTGSAGTCTFSFWLGQSTTNAPLQYTAPSTNQTLSAVYECSIGGPTSITVYAHRVPAGYWAPCFATVCAAGTGPGASMFFALYDSGMNLVATGFSNEDGYTFSGLTAGGTYYLVADNCDSCHGSTHDVLFDHWGNGATADPATVMAGSVLDSWYTCTNGCGGG
jgi:hypothetical protein